MAIMKWIQMLNANQIVTVEVYNTKDHCVKVKKKSIKKKRNNDQIFKKMAKKDKKNYVDC